MSGCSESQKEKVFLALGGVYFVVNLDKIHTIQNLIHMCRNMLRKMQRGGPAVYTNKRDNRQIAEHSSTV